MRTKGLPTNALGILLFLGSFPIVVGCGSAGPVLPEAPDYGVLIMAHGGKEEWNGAVLEAAENVGESFPVEVAFGMADPETIQEGVRRLEASGVGRIGVVRLFVSGDSWYERTRMILGLAEGATKRSEEAASGASAAPSKSESHDVSDGEPDGHYADHGGHGSSDGGYGSAEDDDPDPSGHGSGSPFATPWRIETRSRFALSKEGLSQAREMDQVLLARARDLSTDPSREDVLILAHGPGDDEENELWIANISARAELLRRELPFHRVAVMTLREDWDEKRPAAEEAIRGFIRQTAEGGRTAIVIPFRVHGFGPYHEVLAELEYTADETGLLPHEAVVDWIERQAMELAEGPFRSPLP